MTPLCPALPSECFQGPQCRPNIQPVYTCTRLSSSCFWPGSLMIGQFLCCANSGWSSPYFYSRVFPIKSAALWCHHSSAWNPSICVPLPCRRDLHTAPGATRPGRQWWTFLLLCIKWRGCSKEPCTEPGVKEIKYLFKFPLMRGTWVAQSVMPVPSAQVMIPECWDGVPRRTPCSGGVYFSPSPSAFSPAPPLSLAYTKSLKWIKSFKNNKFPLTVFSFRGNQKFIQKPGHELEMINTLTLNSESLLCHNVKDFVQSLHYCGWHIHVYYFFLKKILYIYSWETHKERQRHRGRSRLLAGNRMREGLNPRLGITPWAEGRCSTAEPPRYPHPCLLQWALSPEAPL